MEKSISTRTLRGLGWIIALAAGALLIALVPTFWSVMSAQVLIGGASSIFGPAICAISLGIVGHRIFFLAAVAAAALGIPYFFMPETRAER